MKNIIIYFLRGGVVTTLIVMAEESGFRTLSGFATLMPVFTLVSYIFIGESKGGRAVAQHSKFVLAGTLAAWVPYMIAVAVLSPRIGAQKAIASGLGVFGVCCLTFLYFVFHYKLFQ